MLYQQYSKRLCEAIENIAASQGQKLLEAAEIAAETIEKDGLIYIFGCGHSGMMSCEGFYRAGGLACAAPIFDEPLMLHESASESSRLEKLSGYAEKLNGRYPIEARDTVIVFSTSDKNAVPVEFAEYVRTLGARVIAVCSGAYFASEVHNKPGKHLHEVCDMYIDNLAPFGDACLQPEGTEMRMTPMSSVTGAYILNSILAEAAQTALSHGADVPVYLSGNIPGGAERNRALIERYRSRIPHL